MNKPMLASVVAGLFVLSLPAQQFIETFPYPDGPIPPASGWTAQSGTWSIRNGRAIQTQTVWGYLTRDNVQALDCVVDADCSWVGAGLQFGGTAARHPGGAPDNAVMVKIQSNSAAPQGFDTAWNYERPGTAVSRTGIAPPLTQVRVRLQLQGNTSWMWVDEDRNGTWDFSVGPKTLTAHAAAGLIGINGYTSGASTEIDNVAFFDAVCTAAPGSTPIIGTTYQMDLFTPAPSNTPYFGAISLTPGSTPLPDGRAIPFGLDALASLTLSLNASIGLGGVTNASGGGTLSFAIPNRPILIGVRLVAGAFTLDLARPFGIGHISNDHQFVVQ